MKVRRIETLESFEALAPLWHALATESGQTSPFLGHEWLGCCWRAAGPRRPETLLVEDASGPVGVVPLVHWTGALHGLPVRFVGLLNAPDTAFSDWLVVGRPEPVIEAVMAHLSTRSDWDVLALNALPPSSLTLKALQTWLPGRYRWQRIRPLLSPYVTTTGTWEQFWAGTSQRFKKTVRNVKNRLAKAGTASVEEHRDVAPDSAVFTDLLEVSARSWKAPRALAIATMPGMAQFFRELTVHASARGWLRLWIMRLDGRPVATEYQLEADGRVHALRADIDAAVPDDLSPGTHLSAEIVRTLFGRESVYEYDMGPGDNDYKTRWAQGAHELSRLRIYRPGAYGTLLHTIEARLLETVRRLRGEGAAA
ncbi:MAG TPA: GNAT family N-acetyltransferase [Candidatus Bathyarchaeia archaeon]|nr:GNAT family N-acetyltransferase [Candidatus Bathyarchaeia archaeon]